MTTQPLYSRNTGQTYADGEIYEHGRNLIQKKSLLSAEDFRARMLARLESEQALAATDLGFIWKRLEQSDCYDLRTQSLKTLLGFEQTDLPPCCVTLTRSGMTRNGKLYTLASSVHHIHEKECSLWPTPTETDYKGGNANYKKRKDVNRESYLRVATYPDDGGKTTYPHPSFVEYLMGFPLAWTEPNVSETQ